MKRCSVFSAGPDDCGWTKRIDDLGYVIGADAGYLMAAKHGIKPDLIVGDFDSSPQPDFFNTDVYPEEKDDTDTGIAVKDGLGIGCREFLLFGCTGGLLDHTVANIHLIAGLDEMGCTGWIINDMQAITVRGIGKFEFACDPQTRFSVFSWGDECIVSYENVKYPLEHYCLTNKHPLGVSNESIDSCVNIEIESGQALIIISGISNTFIDCVYNKV